jgi:endonuclease/exonuclease/phosphatase family metal-dependent hydrolase
MHDKSTARIRVAVQNVWARYGAWPQRRELLQEGLRAAEPDLVTFVEPVRDEHYDQVADLLGPGYEIVYQSAHDGDVFGSAVASRWPIEAVHELDLRVTERTADSLDVTLAAEIVAPDPIGPLLFLAPNPKWKMGYERERELQALVAARYAERYAASHEAHVILAGDFDAVPDAASIRFLRGRQSLDGISVCYRDAWESVHGEEPGHTFTPRNPLVRDGETAWDVPRRIDYVMVRCDDYGPTLDIRDCRRLFDEPRDGVWASDHFGVVAELMAR